MAIQSGTHSSFSAWSLVKTYRESACSNAEVTGCAWPIPGYTERNCVDALVFGCLVQPADSPGHSAAHRFAIDRDARRYKGDRACGNDDVLGCDRAAHIHPACRAMTAIDTHAQTRVGSMQYLQPLRYADIHLQGAVMLLCRPRPGRTIAQYRHVLDSMQFIVVRSSKAASGLLSASPGRLYLTV